MTFSGTLAEKAENKWQAFVKAGDTSGIIIPGGAEFRHTAQRVFAFSDFVSETCIRHPDLLVDLVQSGDLERRYLADEYGKTLTASSRRCRRGSLTRQAPASFQTAGDGTHRLA